MGAFDPHPYRILLAEEINSTTLLVFVNNAQWI